MNQFKIFQQALEETYPGLSVFSDLKWDEVSQEYLASHEEVPTDLEEFVFNFPQFLQDKAAAGDCPAYLFEVAFFELLQNQIQEADLTLPIASGVYLNPSLSFLSLDYDVAEMLQAATIGQVQVIERPHVLSLYRHVDRGFEYRDITPQMLDLLQRLEDGPIKPKVVLTSSEKETLQEMLDLGLAMKVI
jgi:hypothetical protein